MMKAPSTATRKEAGVAMEAAPVSGTFPAVGTPGSLETRASELHLLTQDIPSVPQATILSTVIPSEVAHFSPISAQAVRQVAEGRLMEGRGGTLAQDFMHVAPDAAQALMAVRSVADLPQVIICCVHAAGHSPLGRLTAPVVSATHLVEQARAVWAQATTSEAAAQEVAWHWRPHFPRSDSVLVGIKDLTHSKAHLAAWEEQAISLVTSPAAWVVQDSEVFTQADPQVPVTVAGGSIGIGRTGTAVPPAQRMPHSPPF